MAEITEQQQAVLDAAKAWADTQPSRPDMYSELFDAVRALEPEPDRPIGFLLIDDDGDAWRLYDGGWAYSDDTKRRSYAEVVQQYGPVTHVVPESEAFPIDLARRLTSALRVAANAHCEQFHGQHGDEWFETTCPQSECKADRELIAEAEAALPKAVA